MIGRKPKTMQDSILFTIVLLIGTVGLVSVTSNTKNFLAGPLSNVFIVSAAVIPVILTVLTVFVLGYLYYDQYLYATTILFIVALTFFNISENIWTQNLVVKETDPTYSSETLKVTTVNVLYDNPDKAETLGKELDSLDSDIIFMVEYGPEVAEGLHPLSLKYKNIYFPENDNNDMPDIAIYSKYELYNTRTVWFKNRPILLAEINFNGETITVSTIHTMSPVNALRTQTWFEEFKKFEQIFGNIKTPLIVAGDFNASIGHRPYRDFVNNTNLKDTTLGVNTWSNRNWIPTWMHLDHVLVSKHWNKNADTIVGKGVGSDHKPVTVTLSLAK